MLFTKTEKPGFKWLQLIWNQLRMTEIQGAIGREQLKIEKWNKKRMTTKIIFGLSQRKSMALEFLNLNVLHAIYAMKKAADMQLINVICLLIQHLLKKGGQEIKLLKK